MNREEILKKSRAENKNRDVFEMEVTNRGMVLGNLAACIVAFAALTAQLFWGWEMDYSLFSVLYSSAAVIHWYKWIKLKQKHELLVAVLYTFCVAIFTALFLRNLFA